MRRPTARFGAPRVGDIEPQSAIKRRSSKPSFGHSNVNFIAGSSRSSQVRLFGASPNWLLPASIQKSY